MSDIQAGKWAVIGTEFSHRSAQIVKVTPALVKFAQGPWGSQAPHRAAIAYNLSEGAANKLAECIKLAADEKIRRVRAAQDWFEREVASLAAAAMERDDD